MVEVVDIALARIQGRDVLSAQEVADLLLDLRRYAQIADAWFDAAYVAA